MKERGGEYSFVNVVLTPALEQRDSGSMCCPSLYLNLSFKHQLLPMLFSWDQA